VTREVRHQEGGPDQIAPEVAQLDSPELAAGLAGAVEVLHAIAPMDLRREQIGRGLDLLIEEAAELLGVVHDPLILLLGAGDADRPVASYGPGRTLGHRHEVLPSDELRR
jgi:hypothetical protein